MKARLIDELKAGFRVEHCVDLYKATEALAAAITEELKPVTESSINATWQSVSEELALLQQGFIVAVDDGEYSTFIVLDDTSR